MLSFCFKNTLPFALLLALGLTGPPATPPASQKIAMTAPVAMEPLPAAGQAEAGQQAMQGATRWRVHFVMPSAYTLATLPKPNNPPWTLPLFRRNEIMLETL